MSGLAVRGLKTPLLPVRALKPPLLLDDTGALFKFCRFMEVEENVLFKIRSLKALVLMSRKQQYSEAAGPGKSSRSTSGFVIFLLDLFWCLLFVGWGGGDRIKYLKRNSSGCKMT